MKKSLHSVLTAAMFAAALTTSAGGSAVPAQGAAPAEAGLMELTEREPQDVYGPPSWFETEPEKTEMTEPVTQPAYGPPVWLETEPETTVTDIEPQPDYGPPHWDPLTETTAETTITTEPIPQPAYGPPWMFAAPGDLNYDFSLDARDLTLLKRYLLSGKMDDASYRLANVNGDGEIDKKDVKELIRMLTGKPEDEDDPDVTTTAATQTATTETVTTTTDPYWNVPVPLYGPPSALI